VDAVECTGDYFPSPAARRYVRNRHSRAIPQLAPSFIYRASSRAAERPAIIRQETP
jgi:hypothetical protein